MSAALQSTRHGQTMVLTLSNPEQRNALDPAIHAAGIEALNVAESSDEVRCVVITGEGTVFSGGSDARQLQAEQRASAFEQAAHVEGLHSWIESIRTFPKPVLAAVEGAATGDGFALALACDFIVAARNAVFALDQSRAALSPVGGASWHLARAMPRALATELLMLGDAIEAERLQALGIVNRIAAPGSALQTALGLADRLGACAPNALASIKELLHDAGSAALSAQMARERDLFVTHLHHPNAGIALAATLDKTTPHFR
jgi:enoyl-CoA hydratase/carnithine racemase